MMMRNANKVVQRFLRRFFGGLVPPSPPPLVPPAPPPPPKSLPPNLKAAFDALVDFGAVQSVQWRNKVVFSHDGVHPDMIVFVLAFVKECGERGLPLFPIELVRDQARQDMLFRQGRSKARFGASAHNYGMAVDMVHLTRFWDMSEKQWAAIAVIGKEVARKRGLKVTWGGDWNFYDPAHWELTDWKQRKGWMADVYDPEKHRAKINSDVPVKPFNTNYR